MASATLLEIRKKIRRITHSPSEAQLTTVELDEYINTFYQYDFPAEIRLFTNYGDFNFFTAPNVDFYPTNTNDPVEPTKTWANSPESWFDALYPWLIPVTDLDPLKDFKNKVITVHPPVYVDGQPVFFTQSPNEFYGIYPKNKIITDTKLRGDGVKLIFSGILSTVPIQASSASFTSVGADNQPLNLRDVGGTLLGDGFGSIDYLTGAFSLTFNKAPAANKKINAHVFAYKASRPQAVLYHENAFIVRPIPDDVYEVNMQVYKSLTDLLTEESLPEINQWWQYISYGAAKKIFQDRMDLDSVNLILPEFKNQEKLALRRTLVQQSNERTSTIFTDNLTPFGFGSKGFF